MWQIFKILPLHTLVCSLTSVFLVSQNAFGKELLECKSNKDIGLQPFFEIKEADALRYLPKQKSLPFDKFKIVPGYKRKVFNETVEGHKTASQIIEWTYLPNGSAIGKATWKVDNWMGTAKIQKKYKCTLIETVSQETEAAQSTDSKTALDELNNIVREKKAEETSKKRTKKANICGVLTKKNSAGETVWDQSSAFSDLLEDALQSGLDCGVNDSAAEEKAKREADISAKNKAEVKSKTRSWISRKEKAEEKAKREAELAAKKKAEEKAKREAELAAKKKAKEKAKREAELAAKKRAEEKRLKNFREHKDMLSDIELFASQETLFDPVKIGGLFVNFNQAKKGEWDEQASSAYEKLSTYALSIDEFREFREQRELDRSTAVEQSIAKISTNLNEQAALIKNYISKNLASPKTPTALGLLDEIEKEKSGVNLPRLSALNDKVNAWVKKNVQASPDDDTEKTTSKVSEETVTVSSNPVDGAKAMNLMIASLKKAIVSKEFGDGFSNFEASNNKYLVGVFIKLRNDTKEVLYLNDLEFRLTFSNGVISDHSAEATSALAIQEDLSDLEDTRIKPNNEITTGVGFVVPSTVLELKKASLEVLAESQIVYKSDISMEKN